MAIISAAIIFLPVPYNSADAAGRYTGNVPEYHNTPVMAAYQKSYAMNFEIWKPSDLPAGWYATFDGYPVAQIDENKWVYGRTDSAGKIYPTDILVGSVIPSDVPALARMSSFYGYGVNFNSKQFLKVRSYMCNRIGWFYDGGINTIIAWNIYKPGVYLWMGKRWRLITPNSGEYTWQTLKRLRPQLAKELYKNDVWFYGGEPLELADLARQWGMLWAGRVVLERHLGTFNSGNDGGTELSSSSSESSSSTTSLSDSSRNGGGSSNNNTGPHWDVD